MHSVILVCSWSNLRMAGLLTSPTFSLGVFTKSGQTRPFDLRAHFAENLSRSSCRVAGSQRYAISVPLIAVRAHQSPGN